MLSQSVIVVCNAPLVAPIPLPYNSPRFLQFDLPDIGEDLSHPPYTSRHVHPAQKRKLDTSDMDVNYPEPKRRTSTVAPVPRRASNAPPKRTHITHTINQRLGSSATPYPPHSISAPASPLVYHESDSSESPSMGDDLLSKAPPLTRGCRQYIRLILWVTMVK